MLRELAAQIGIVDAESWVEEVMVWGDAVSLYRDYTSGAHPYLGTERQKTALKLAGKDFSFDYTDTIVRAMSERLVIEAIFPESGDEGDALWIDEIWSRSDFDILQTQLHNAALRDGDAYIVINRLVGETGIISLVLQLDFAWDGATGIIPISYGANGQLASAVKVFEVDNARFAWHYEIGKITYYEIVDSSVEDKGSVPFEGPLPIISFSNRREPNSKYGISEIKNVLSSQDALNRTLLDMLTNSMFGAFPILFAKGFDFPGVEIAPGVVINPEGIEPDALPHADLKAIPASDSAGYIAQADRIVEFMADISQTPLRSKWGADLSGEAIKQLEAGLLSKIEAAQVYLGGSWEYVFNVASRIGNVYTNVSVDDLFTIEWEEPEVRSDQSVIEQAVMVYNVTRSIPMFIKMIEKVLDWDEDEIESFLKDLDKRQEMSYNNNGNDEGMNGMENNNG